MSIKSANDEQIGLSLGDVIPVMFAFSSPSPDGTQHTVLTPSLAAQCGYSMESDPWGNTRIYTSLLACYVNNKVCGAEVI